MTKIVSRRAFLKLVIVNLFICLYFFSTAQTFVNNQDDANGNKRISIAASNESINDILKRIKRATGLSPFMRGEVLNDLQEKVSLNVTNERLDNILQRLLEPRGYTFQFNDNVIIIRKKGAETPLKKNESDSSITMITLAGKVTDAAGAPLVGATVMIKGTREGSITDAEGQFTLPNVHRGATLLISSVGYETREVQIKGKNMMAQLNLLVNDLDETVVIAYGTTTKRYNTGNVSTIKAKDIEKQPVSNPLLALQGRVPGITIEQATGLPGSGIRVRIQGQNSLKKGSDPLYVIDGVPYTSRLLGTLSGIQGNSGENAPNMANIGAGAGNPLSFINPMDIESIDILKDADATSIYGSRAANGAILITTKKGKAGKTSVNINLQNGWGTVARKVKLLNTQQYLALRKEAFTNDGLPIPTVSTPPNQSNLDLTLYDQNKNTDWQEVLIGNTAQYTRMNTSVSGGTPTTQFLIRAGYQRETTVFPGDLSDKKGSLHVNLNNTSSNQRFKVTFSGSYMLDDNRLIAEDLTGTAMNLAPNAPALYNTDGTLNWALLPNGEAGWRNPLAFLKQKYRSKNYNLIANTTVSYQLLPDLAVSSSFGYTNLRSDQILINPLSSYAPQEWSFRQSKSNISSGVISTWIIEPQLNYKKAIGRGTLEVLLGSTFQQNAADWMSIEGTGYSSELLLENVSSAANRKVANGSSVYRYNAAFGRLNYNWSNKYIATLSARRDGSSRFGAANLFHNFGSIAGAWLFSNENFFKNELSFLSFGKLRVSYGTTGNDAIGEYQFLNLYNTVFSSLPYQGVTGLEPSGLPNPYLQWEETRKLSVGIDIGLLDDRILFDVNYYRNRSSNQLLDYQLPVVTGFQNITQNLAATVQNIGWEISLNTENINKSGFQWHTNFNITIPKNELVSYPDLETSPYVYEFVVGQPTNIRKVYKFAGVNPETGLYQVLDKEGKVIPAGQFATVDDRVVSIDLNPEYYGGIQNIFRYRNFELDILFQFVKQKGAYNYFGNGTGQFYGAGNVGNQPIEVLDHWKKANDIAPVQKIGTGILFENIVSEINAGVSDAIYGDASYLRLKNLSFSWSLPQSWQRKGHIWNARFFLQGQNLWTITNYKGLDPETRSSFSLPPLRVFTLGINVSI